MTKIMLVEDDKSLREIYGVRLLAEGYDIVSAGDGEEALAMAIKERPHLIISDVMMPKISGFDLLDILRSTTETKNIKVIMMTALSSEDQRQRGEQLGADRYLVKSQVGIEDVVHVVAEVLEGQAMPPHGAPTETSPSSYLQPPAQAQPAGQTAMDMAGSSPLPVLGGVQPPAPESSGNAPRSAQSRPKIITPINDPTVGVNLSELLDKEIAKEAGLDLDNTPKVVSSDQTKNEINEQINTFSSEGAPQTYDTAFSAYAPSTTTDAGASTDTQDTTRTPPAQADVAMLSSIPADSGLTARPQSEGDNSAATDPAAASLPIALSTPTNLSPVAQPTPSPSTVPSPTPPANESATAQPAAPQAPQTDALPTQQDDTALPSIDVEASGMISGLDGAQEQAQQPAAQTPTAPTPPSQESTPTLHPAPTQQQ